MADASVLLSRVHDAISHREYDEFVRLLLTRRDLLPKLLAPQRHNHLVADKERMADKRECRDNGFNDPKQCPNQDFPCYDQSRHVCINHEGEAEPTCPEPLYADRVECANMWPKYPCYDKRKRACYDEKGTTQLFDPVADCVYAVANGYNSICDAVGYLTGIRRSVHTTRKQKQDMYDTINKNWSYFPNPDAYTTALDRVVKYEYVRLGLPDWKQSVANYWNKYQDGKLFAKPERPRKANKTGWKQTVTDLSLIHI